MSESKSLEAVKHGPKESGALEIILERWSPRTFAPKPVSRHDLRIIFTAAGWAASSNNEQPWRFLVGIKDDPESGETWTKIFNSLAEGNQAWANSAPVLYTSIAKKTFARNGNPNGVALHDVGAATATASLQATSLGMHTHGMAGFDKTTLRAYFGLPEDFEPVACWALGYLGDPNQLPDKLKEIELAPRTRKGLNEYVFTEWEKPASL